MDAAVGAAGARRVRRVRGVLGVLGMQCAASCAANIARRAVLRVRLARLARRAVRAACLGALSILAIPGAQTTFPIHLRKTSIAFRRNCICCCFVGFLEHLPDNLRRLLLNLRNYGTFPGVFPPAFVAVLTVLWNICRSFSSGVCCCFGSFLEHLPENSRRL